MKYDKNNTFLDCNWILMQLCRDELAKECLFEIRCMPFKVSLDKTNGCSLTGIAMCT